MAEEIAFENGRISNFEGLVILTLTLDRVILHTFAYHPSTCSYTANLIEIDETFCLRTYARTHVRIYVYTRGRTDGRIFETCFIRSKSRHNNNNNNNNINSNNTHSNVYGDVIMP